MKHRLLGTLVAAALALAIATPAFAAAGAKPGTSNIVEIVLTDDNEFDVLQAAVIEAGLAGALSSPDDQYTVFAPTDAAFKRVPKATIDALLKDRAMLRAVLLYHVVPGKVTAAKVVKLRSAKTANGATLRIRVAGSNVFVNKARVTKADIGASNGVIHVVHRVLVPPA